MAEGRGPGGGRPPVGRPTRRAVLSGALLTGAGLAGALSGCGGNSAAPPPDPRPAATPDPDTELVGAVLAGKRELLARHAATVARHPGDAPGLAAARADHEGHLRALAASPAAPGGATGSGPAPSAAAETAGPSPAPGGPATPAVPAERAAAVRALAAAERDAADLRLGQCVAARDPELARLLASVGACEAAHGLVLAALAEAAAP